MSDLLDLAGRDDVGHQATQKPAAVFIAGPFFKSIDPATGRLPARDQARIEGLISHFEDKGSEVFNAHKREARLGRNARGIGLGVGARQADRPASRARP